MSTRNPSELNIFNLCMTIAPMILGTNQPSQQIAASEEYYDEPQVQTLDGKDVALITLRQKAGSVTVVVGSRETGKTELCYRLMEFLDRPAYAVSPQQKPPSWIQQIELPDVMENVPPDSTLLMDDLPAYMSNKDYNETFTRIIEKAIPMVRHDPNPPAFPLGRVHLIFSTQSTSQADRYILDCDVAFFKPLGLLMGDIERPNIAKLYKQNINPLFEGKDDYWMRRHAYMMSRSFKGLIEVSKTS